MTAQLERNPREGVELDEAWTWRDYLAMTLSYAFTAGVGVCLWFPYRPLIGALSLAAGLTVIVAFVLDAVRKPEF